MATKVTEHRETNADEDPLEMDPIKMIMEQLGNQYIILKVFRKEFIS